MITFCDLMADGKQLIFELERIQINDSIDNYSEVHHFKPKIEDLAKHVTLKVSGGTDIDARLAKLGLPKNKGDLVTIEIGVKEIQSKLVKEEPKKEKKEDKS